MPVIQPLRQTQTLEQGSPVPIGSSDQARLPGESISALGKGVEEAAAGIGDYFQRKDAADRQVSMAKFSADAVKAAQDAQNDAINNASPDGSNLLSGFQDKYSKWVKDNANQFADQSLKDQALIHGQQVSNRYGDQLFEQARKMHASDAVNQMEGTRNTLSNSIQNDPGIYASTVANYADSIAKSGLYRPADIAAAQIQAKTDFASSAVNGFIDRKDYTGAKNFIKTQAPDVYDAKARETMFDHIDNEATKDLNRQLQEKNMENALVKQQQDEEQKANFAGVMQKLNGAQSVDDRLAVRKQVDNLVSQGKLGMNEGRFLNQVANESTVQDDDTLAFNLSTKLHDPNTTPQNVRNDIIEAVNNGDLSSKKGLGLLSHADTIINKVASDPVMKVKNQQAKAIYDSAFGKDFFDKFLPGDSAAHKADAMTYGAKLINQGMDPVDAARASVSAYATPLKALPYAPYSDYSKQNDAAGLQQAATEIVARQKSGQIDITAATSALTIIAQRRKAIDTEAMVQQNLKQGKK